MYRQPVKHEGKKFETEDAGQLLLLLHSWPLHVGSKRCRRRVKSIRVQRNTDARYADVITSSLERNMNKQGAREDSPLEEIESFRIITDNNTGFWAGLAN